jgi:hypothetical protein
MTRLGPLPFFSPRQAPEFISMLLDWLSSERNSHNGRFPQSHLSPRETNHSLDLDNRVASVARDPRLDGPTRAIPQQSLRTFIAIHSSGWKLNFIFVLQPSQVSALPVTGNRDHSLRRMAVLVLKTHSDPRWPVTACHFLQLYRHALISTTATSTFPVGIGDMLRTGLPLHNYWSFRCLKTSPRKTNRWGSHFRACGVLSPPKWPV